MIKVCFYSNDEKIMAYEELSDRSASGTLASMLNVAFGLSRKGCEVVVLGNYEHDYTKNGISYRSIVNITDMISYSGDFNVFIFVGHCGSEISKRLLSDKVFFWAHNWVEPERYSELVFQGVIDGIVFVSYYHRMQYILKSINKRVFKGLDLRKLLVIYNAVCNDVFNSCINTNTGSRSIEKSTLELAFVGFPSVNKGFDKVCRLVEWLNSNADRKVVLHVYGGRDLYAASKVCLDTLNNEVDEISDCIIMHGAIGRSGLYKNLKAHDAVVSGMNASETFCVSLLEACCLGVRVISCDAGGQLEFLKHGDNAFLLPYNQNPSDKDFLKIMNYLCGNEKVFNSYSLYGERFSIDSVAGEWVNLFENKRDIFFWYRLMLSLKYFVPIFKARLR